jgi:hypothetical protein
MSIAFDNVLCVDTSFIINARKRKTEVQHQPYSQSPSTKGQHVSFSKKKKKKREEMYFIMHLQKKSKLR